MDTALNANVLITSGPTHEYIDDVRFIGNPSTGRMGIELAKSAMAAGARATVISGPTHLKPQAGSTWVPVVSAQQMYDAVAERFEACDVFIAAAAVSDYRPKDRLAGKYKKGPKTITLELEKTTDILHSMGKRRRGDQTLVGYSLEVDDPIGHGREKLHRKHCDLMVVNTPGHFGNATEHVWIINRAGVVAELPPSGKDRVAATVIELVAKLRRGETLPLVRTLEDE